MRITSGELGGRPIRVPPGIRPTQDKVRQALFSSLGDLVAGARVLDLYAGSGALGLEAWSRGASYVCWVEQSVAAYRQLRENVRALCGESPNADVIRSDALAFLSKGEASPFDLVLADPPYGAGILENALRLMGVGSILRVGGVFVLEQGVEEPVAVSAGWRPAGDKRYGETRLLTFVKQMAGV
jgi:16S rRNA (guanine966-N2)-methyltransferase